MTTTRLFRLLPALLVLAVVAFSSFAFRPTAQREPRTVGAFTGVELGGSAHVVFKQGSPQKVEVEGEAADLEMFETVVKNGSLRLNFRSGTHWSLGGGSHQITVYITAPTLNAVSVSGSGEIRVDGVLQTSKLALSVSGSGNMKIAQLTASDVQTSLSGSGNILLGGTAPQHSLSVSGSGDIKAHDLKTEITNVSISGSGKAHLFASKVANSSIRGSGNVYVAGGAQLHTATAGSGRVQAE